MTTHGNEDLICIEVYNDETPREQRYTYLRQWYETWEIGKETADSKYCITALPGGIETWSDPRKQIYFLGACYSETLFDDFCGGLQLGYTDGVSTDDLEHDADILFKNMSGRYNNATKRRSGDALALEGYTPNFMHSGVIENDTVLAPGVVDWLPKEAACPDIQGWVEFDCTMDASHKDLILGSGCVNLDTESVYWVNDHEVAFGFEPGEGDIVEICVDAQKAVSANNHDIHLDGNLNPEDTNAVAPNRTTNGYDEDFVWTVACDCSGCPARVTATIDGVGSGECENCFRGFYGAYYHPCTDLNGSCFLYREAGECNWTAGMPGFQEFTLSRDGDTWHFTVEGRDRAVWRTCASWTAPNTTCCPPDTGWTWDGGCCSEGALELSW
jgi:hypothetical protein